MAYITIAQLIVHYPEDEITQLSDRANTGVRVDPVIQSAIDRASAMIDANLSKCYALPLTGVNGAALPSWILIRLEEMCGRITRFLLTEDARLGGTAEQAPHETRARYIEEMKLLGGLNPNKVGGCLLLPGAKLLDSTADAANEAPNVLFTDQGRVFARDPDMSDEFATRNWP
jgi:phage gp36-like protein